MPFGFTWPDNDVAVIVAGAVHPPGTVSVAIWPFSAPVSAVWAYFLSGDHFHAASLPFRFRMRIR
jgi:hypothetical protein